MMIIRWRAGFVHNSWGGWGFKRNTMTDLQKQRFHCVLYLGPIFIAWKR